VPFLFKVLLAKRLIMSCYRISTSDMGAHCITVSIAFHQRHGCAFEYGCSGGFSGVTRVRLISEGAW
jgi:hypothetical protein